jgi:hypothetical protein
MSILSSFLVALGVALMLSAIIAGVAWVIVFYPAYILAVFPVGFFLAIWGIVHDVMKVKKQ